MRRVRLRLIVLAVVVLAIGAAGIRYWQVRDETRIARMNFEDAAKAFQAGEHRTAYRVLRQLAERGDAEAQVELAWLYREGYGTDRNDAEAFNWYLRAADLGNTSAMAFVMWYYRNGYGLEEKDLAAAARWAARLAELDHIEGQFWLGRYYLEGTGVPKNLESGRTWLLKAAGNGDGRAMNLLSNAYLTGTFGEPDYESALHWMITAVRYDVNFATSSLVRMLHDESLPVFDLEQAYFWALVGYEWEGERSIVRGDLEFEIVKILYQTPDDFQRDYLRNYVDISALTRARAAPDQSQSDVDYESWLRRLDVEAQHRVEAEVWDYLARWPEPPMSQ